MRCQSCISKFAQLESRRLLSAVLDGFWLRVTGTNHADQITVRWIDSPSRIEVTINNSFQFFASNQVGAISIEGLEGNDFIRNQVGKTASIMGGAGNDTIFGGAGRNYFYGGAGDDSLVGGSRMDLMYGDRDSESGLTLPGDDTMMGNGDNDWFYSDAGSDFIDGGSDIASNESLEFYDVAYYVRRTDNLSLTFDNLANDGASGETGNLVNVEGISSGSGNDLIVGNDRSNVTMLGGHGHDTINTLAGNDSIQSFDSGDDLIDAGSGNDTIFPDDDDTVFGSSGNDFISLSTGNATLHGGSGNDTLTAPGTTSELWGEGGDDTLQVFLGINVSTSRIINGGSGKDSFVYYNFGVSVGTQISLDGVANDGRTAAGDQDNVTLIESIQGGRGDDLFDASMIDYAVTLRGDFGYDTLIGGGGADLLEGGDGFDSLTGNANNDRLRGDNGNDVLIGNAGSDRFNGGPGVDTMMASDGEADILIGGTGLHDEADVDELLDDVSGVEILT